MQWLEQILAVGNSRPTASLGACLRACGECELVCLVCAETCLAERELEALRRCVRLSFRCAELCAFSARLLIRYATVDRATLRSVLEACSLACATCAEECQRHAATQTHCRVCASACQTCAECCEALIEATGYAPDT